MINILKKLFKKQNSPTQANVFSNQEDGKKDFLIYLAILFVVFFAIVITNFPFNSWYTGWDNLHPEFNFALNFKRSINVVWQANQGLGTFGGHGYAATLPHTVMLFLLSFFISAQYLRSIFTFLTLIVGALGVFFLIRKFLQEHQDDLKNKSALFGSLFYLLNFGTVQNFYIQLEAFIIHFAALPWLFLTLINYLEKKNKKNLILFALVTLISSAQGFIPPLFFVYIILLSLFLFFYLFSKFSIERLKDVILLFIITIVINAYWFLPVVYYSFTHSSNYLNAYNNLASTGDFILQNKKYGNIQDLVVIKGFIIDALDSSTNGATINIFNRWQMHLNSPSIFIIGLTTFGIILIGLVYLIRKKSHYYYLASVAGFLLIFSLLATNTPPFSFISAVLQKIPIIHQAFRVAFTKFSISLAFFYSIGFAMGMFWILSKITRNKIRNLIATITVILLLYFALPTFKGYFLYQRTKINIPNIYLQLFDYFHNQDPNTRIANVPIGWHWGWSVYKWGYSGSGFLWYGIEQSIMDRAFDVWGKYNENYYWEISQAIYSENFQLLDKLVEKYQINWLLFDKNIIPYPNAKGYLYGDKLEEYLNNSKKYELIKVFSSDTTDVADIKIYRVNLFNPVQEFKNIKPLSSIKNIIPVYDFTDFDQAYYDFGEYYTDNKTDYKISYPNRSLFTKRQPTKDMINTNNLPLIYDSETDSNFFNHQPTSCGSSSYTESQAKQTIISNNILRFTSLNTENCYVIVQDQLTQRDGYLLKIESRHIKGKQLKLNIINNQSKRADIEAALTNSNSFETENIIIPPMQYYGLGYSIGLNNISIGDSESINELKSIKLYQYPYNSLIAEKTQNIIQTENQNNIFTFYQSFDKDWKAYYVNNTGLLNRYFPFIFGQELKNHILVNNWANGWVVADNENIQNIIVIFWPQYLEFTGFILLAVTLLRILLIRQKHE